MNAQNTPDPILQELLTVRDWIRWSASRFSEAHVFFGHGTDNAWDEASQLVMSVLHLRWDDRDLSWDKLLTLVAEARLTTDERRQVFELVWRRVHERLPLPYLTGTAYFAGLPFRVTPEVLIPRSPIGELLLAEQNPWFPTHVERVLDLCTGSGCIGILAALALPDVQVVLSDISDAALQVAQQNIALHAVEDRVTVVCSDAFAALDGSFDLILCNPPYVDADEMARLPAEFVAEPALALASGPDGLDFTRRLLSEAAQYLSEHGVLIVEVGASAAALEQAFPNVPFTWISFAQGGEGVFVFSRNELLRYQADFQSTL